ncbi:MAG: ABC transporter permease [Clostridiales bacterium]|jgi:ribose transport system permease protein|nr:ABC transporter permease [Clostridiales bacterium]
MNEFSRREGRQKGNPLKRLLAIRGMGQVISVTIGLVALCIVFQILSSNFFSPDNLGNLLRQIAPYLIIGIAQSFVLITGNIDLSIGSIMGMSSMMAATMMTKGVHPAWAILITFMSCVFVGVVNGQLVAACKLPPFIATLGTMTIARGIAQIVNNNHNTDTISIGIGKETTEAFKNFFYYGKIFTLGGHQESNGSVIGGFSIYSPVIIAIALWIVFNFMLSKTRTGRHIYATGSNMDAARLSGVNVTGTITAAYVVSAICSCIAGLIVCATTGMGAMDTGNSYELYAVAASVIGGVSTLGGQGILLGTVIGAAVWSVLQNGLQFAGAPVAIRNIVIGVIVVLSVLLDVVIRSGSRRKAKDMGASALLGWISRKSSEKAAP